MALQGNMYIGPGLRGVEALRDMLCYNTTLKDLALQNWCVVLRIAYFSCFLPDFSGLGLLIEGIPLLCAGLQANRAITTLDLSSNSLGEFSIVLSGCSKFVQSCANRLQRDCADLRRAAAVHAEHARDARVARESARKRGRRSHDGVRRDFTVSDQARRQQERYWHCWLRTAHWFARLLTVFCCLTPNYLLFLTRPRNRLPASQCDLLEAGSRWQLAAPDACCVVAARKELCGRCSC